MKQRNIMTTIGALGLIIVLVLTNVGVALASPITPTITVSGCTLTISFTTDQAGMHRVYLVDDFTNVFDQTVNATAGQVLMFSYTFDTPGDVTPGVGIYIEVDGQPAYENNNFSGITKDCAKVTASGGACAVGAPDQAIGAVVIQPTFLYWDADTETRSIGGEMLNADDAVLVVAIDPEGAFYQIVFACGAYWVPVDALSPNPDDVWQGRPLMNRQEAS